MNNSEQSAFGYGFTTSDGSSHVNESGLTKREHFSILALQGILANRELQLALYKDTAIYVKEYPHMNPENCLAIHAVRQADNLLAELEKRTKE